MTGGGYMKKDLIAKCGRVIRSDAAKSTITRKQYKRRFKDD